MKRWDVLNRLARFNGAERYLEIGVQNGESMRHVDVREKWGVDPVPTLAGVTACDVFFRMTSIDFFQRACATNAPTEQDLSGDKRRLPPRSSVRFADTLVGADLVFIDGYHSSELVYKEVELACDILSSKGLIALHDVGPTTEAMQSDLPVPGDWTGDVWKAVVRMRREGRHDVRVVDTDFGVAIVKPHQGGGPRLLPDDEKLSWDLLTRERERLLGIIKEDDLEEWLKS